MLDKSLWGVAQNNLGPDKNDYGSLTYWAPTVNLDRDPRWGRTDEAFGEDPYLVGADGRRVRRRLPGPDPAGRPMTPYLKVAATAKHYALNDVENNRHADSSDTTRRQPPRLLHRAVPGPDPGRARVRPDDLVQRDQRHAGAGRHLHRERAGPADLRLRRLHHLRLRRGRRRLRAGQPQLGAAGLDHVDRQRRRRQWTNTATGQQVPGAAGGQAYALRAGTQLNCTGAEDTLANIQEAIKAGVLSPRASSTTRWCTCSPCGCRPASSTRPTRCRTRRSPRTSIQSPAHQALAAKVADNSLVLLKNDPCRRRAPLLPADPAKLEQRGRRRRPGRHGHPRRLLRRAVAPGERGRRASPPRSRRPTRRHRHLRRLRHVHRRDRGRRLLGGDPGRDQDRRPGRGVRRHRHERGRRGQRPHHHRHAGQLRLADRPGARGRQPADGAGRSRPTARSRSTTCRTISRPSCSARYNGREPGHRAGRRAVRQAESRAGTWTSPGTPTTRSCRPSRTTASPRPRPAAWAAPTSTSPARRRIRSAMACATPASATRTCTPTPGASTPTAPVNVTWT